MEWSLEDRRLIYRRGLIIRAVSATAFIVFFGGLALAGYADDIPGLSTLLAVLIALLGANPLFWRVGEARNFALGDFRFHWAIDVLAVSAVVYAFGIFDIPITIAAYMIMIVSSATFASRRTAMWLAHWSSICLIGVVVIEEVGILAHQHVEFAAHVGVEGKIVTVVGSIFLFHVFGYLAGEVAAQLREKAEQIDAQRYRLSEALGELRVANERMVLLSALVQHDVYGPLGVVSGACERAISECAKGSAGEVARYVCMVSDNLQSIEGAVATLSALCSVDRGEDSGIVGLESVVARVVRDLNSQAARKNARVEYGGGSADLRVREEELYHALRNLVANALRAVSEDGSGAVTIRTRMGASELHVDVEDNGSGFSPTAVGAVDGGPVTGLPQRAEAGFGVGLRLVSSIVRGWGGEVERFNREVGGARVTIRVPMTRIESIQDNSQHGPVSV